MVYTSHGFVVRDQLSRDPGGVANGGRRCSCVLQRSDARQRNESGVSKPSPLLGMNLHGSASSRIQLSAVCAAVHSLKCHLQIVGMAGQKKIAPV